MSATHILILVLILLLLFGPSKLPQLGQSLGRAIKGFKEGLNEIDADARKMEDTRKEELTTKKEDHKEKQS